MLRLRFGLKYCKPLGRNCDYGIAIASAKWGRPRKRHGRVKKAMLTSGFPIFLQFWFPKKTIPFLDVNGINPQQLIHRHVGPASFGALGGRRCLGRARYVCRPGGVATARLLRAAVTGGPAGSSTEGRGWGWRTFGPCFWWGFMMFHGRRWPID